MSRDEPERGRTQQPVPSTADERARTTEQQMTDDERFSLIISALGQVPGSSAAQTRDPLIP